MTNRFYEQTQPSLHEQTPYDRRKELHGIIHEGDYNYISSVAKDTLGAYSAQWEDNLKRNARLWKKHNPLMSCVGLGRNKAAIGIGGGQSFKRNSEMLKQIVDEDGVRDWEDRNFYTIASNHQYKPLLEMGISPDFVILVDAADTVYSQLCEDIPPEGQNTTLIAGLHCSPKILGDWSKQGREILFYASLSPGLCEAFHRELKKNPHHHKLELGGNTINAAWMISILRFQSTVFMGVGNDLSFPKSRDANKRREGFYADGDYSSMSKDEGSGRDEAGSDRIWAGFTLKPKKIWLPNEQCRYDVDLELVGTSGQLWVYKVWLETTLLGQMPHPVSFHYYNCSESGILGVMAKQRGEEDLEKVENWYMFDEVCRFYHTATLEDAGRKFAIAKEVMRCQGKGIPDGAQYATGMQDVTGIVKPTSQN